MILARNELETIKNACVLVFGRGSNGPQRATGYLIAPRWVATCAHALSHVGPDELIRLRFSGFERAARLHKLNLHSDCAVLEIDDPVGDVVPLSPAATCLPNTPMLAFGFPKIAGEAGILLQGEIRDALHQDPSGRPAVVVHSQDAQAGAILDGFSGTPVVCHRRVVGHLTRILPDGEGGATFQTIYACPIHYVTDLLPEGALPPARPPEAPGADYHPDWYVHRPSEEGQALPFLRQERVPMVLQGPRHSGKATLLGYLMEQIRMELPFSNIVYLRLASFAASAFESFTTIVDEIIERLIAKLPVSKRNHLHRDLSRSQLPPSLKLRQVLLHESLLPASQPLLLCIEQVEELHRMALVDRNELFELLRALVENRSDPLFRKLRLVLSSATVAQTLVEPRTSPFFNSANFVYLQDLDGTQVQAMAALHDHPLSQDDLHLLEQKLRGHPYLTRLALYHTVVQQVPVAHLFSPVSADGGIFREHLMHLHRWLDEHAFLSVVRDVLQNSRHKLPMNDDYGRLAVIGVIVREKLGIHRLRCPLYEEYFRSLWALA